jgi:hypothetical protein
MIFAAYLTFTIYLHQYNTSKSIITQICTQLNFKKGDYLMLTFSSFYILRANIQHRMILTKYFCWDTKPGNWPRAVQFGKKQMIHGPCGTDRDWSPCMKNTDRCSKFFLKRYNESTIVDRDGYPLYKRSEHSYIVEKNGINLDNRYVVPYNRRLLLKYQAHINMEWCNQSSSIKYLFK